MRTRRLVADLPDLVALHRNGPNDFERSAMRSAAFLCSFTSCSSSGASILNCFARSVGVLGGHRRAVVLMSRVSAVQYNPQARLVVPPRTSRVRGRFPRVSTLSLGCGCPRARQSSPPWATSGSHWSRKAALDFERPELSEVNLGRYRHFRLRKLPQFMVHTMPIRSDCLRGFGKSNIPLRPNVQTERGQWKSGAAFTMHSRLRLRHRHDQPARNDGRNVALALPPLNAFMPYALRCVALSCGPQIAKA
jgi:hypothetical protein